MLFLLSIIGANIANAAPITSNTAICSVYLTSTNHGSAMANYSMNIGRPFISGGGWGPINQALMDDVKIDVYEYQCFTTDNGASTNLSFVSATGHSTKIEVVNALQKAYPMVSFQKQRICLMYGVEPPDSWPSSDYKRAPGFLDDLIDHVGDFFDDIGKSIGFADDIPVEKRNADHTASQIITTDVDAALRKAGVIERSSSTVGLFFDDLDLDQETIDTIIQAHRTSNQAKALTKRNHNCDPHEPHGCDFQPENRTCLMTTGCHDDWVPANDTAICFYRVGWFDVRIGKQCGEQSINQSLG